MGLYVAIGAIGKIAGGQKLMSAMGKALGASDEMMRWGTTGVSQAVVSRHMENLMESSGVYEEEFERAKDMGMSESEAKKFASVAASNTYNKQWALLLQDIPQYLLLNRLGGMGPKNTSMKVARAMGMDPGKTAMTKTATIVRDMAGEAGEEAYQYLVNEQSKLLSQRTIDPNVQTAMSKVWQDNYDSGEMWTAATFGALGAGVMQFGFAGFNAKALKASNKARIAELNSRGQLFKQSYELYQQALDSGSEVEKRQALANFKIILAQSAVSVGNERNMLETLDALTKNPNDEIFDRYGIDPQNGTILKDNPEIAADFKKTVKRVKELRTTFGRENAANRKMTPRMVG